MADKKKPHGRKKNPRKGIKGPSSTGKVKNVRADQTNWRKKLQKSRIKFDDDQKDIYLAELAEHGLKGRSAQKAGVSMQLVLDHLENDPDFAEHYEAAMQHYRDSIADEVKRRGQKGWEEPIFFKGQRAVEPVLDEKGQIVHDDDGNPKMRYCSIRKFSDRLLELEAKRVEPGYRDKQTIDLNTTGGGVLVAPAELTPEEWIKKQQEDNQDKVAKGKVE